MRLRKLAAVALGGIAAAFLAVQIGCATHSMGSMPDPAKISLSAQFSSSDGMFVNTIPTQTGFEQMDQTHGALSRWWRNDQTPNGVIPVAKPDADFFDRPPTDGVRVTWVGHSTMLIELDGFTVLTDPVWSERVSPFPNLGPKRFHEPGIDFDALPPLDAVIISHDHYDHLDHETISNLSWRKVPLFVPIGIGGHLDRWRVKRYTELDWWDEAEITKGDKTLVLAATPARHFSGRSLNDRNKTLWASWVIKTDDHSVYFGGDTGYFAGFREIGRKYGPFDATLMPIGAYDPAWSDIHLNPEEAVQAHLDLGNTGVFLPIHHGTFNLATHGWAEPMERMLTAIESKNVPLYAIPKPGESVMSTVMAPSVEPWWRALAD